MHILLLPSSYPNNYNIQSGIFFKEQAEALAKRKHKVGVLAINFLYYREVFQKQKIDFGIKYSSENNVNVISYQSVATPKLYNLKFWLKFMIGRNLFKRYIKIYGKPDVIHVHVFQQGKLARWIKKKYNINYVVTEHYSDVMLDNLTNYQRRSASKTYSFSCYNIGVSNALCQILQQRYKQSFSFIPNLTDTLFFSLREKKEGNQISFINIANLKKIKNQAILLRAFYLAFKGNDKYQLTIVGDGIEKQNLLSICKELNMINQVRFFGKANKEQVKNELHKSDYYVSTSDTETFGVVLIEAMSCGLPSLSTKNGGAESILTNSNLGILCNSSIQEIAIGLQQLTSTQYNSQEIREYAISHFSDQHVIPQLEEIYINAVKLI